MEVGLRLIIFFIDTVFIQATDDIDDKLARGWTPIPLQPWFWISLSAFMVLVAIGLEIALHFNKQSNGKH